MFRRNSLERWRHSDQASRDRQRARRCVSGHDMAQVSKDQVRRLAAAQQQTHSHGTHEGGRTSLGEKKTECAPLEPTRRDNPLEFHQSYTISGPLVLERKKEEKSQMFRARTQKYLASFFSFGMLNLCCNPADEKAFWRCRNVLWAFVHNKRRVSGRQRYVLEK